MNPILRISLLIGSLIYFAFVIYMVKRRNFTLKHALMWVLSAVILLIIDIFPQIISLIASLLGINTWSNAVFVIIIFFVLIMLISITSIITKQNREIRRLIQEVAILQKEKENVKKDK